MKKLITEKIIEEFAKGGGTVFPTDHNTLITPSAKDLARNKGIAFVNKGDTAENAVEECECRASEKEEEEPKEACEMSYDRQLIVEAVMKALAEKGILDKILDK